MSLSRFYIPREHWKLDSLALAGDEARHCREVMRHGVGDKLVVFNGHGSEAMATVRHLDKDRVGLETHSVSKARRPRVGLTLAQAAIKGKNMELVLQKATELGAARVVPLLSARSVFKLDPKDRVKKFAKWNRVLVEACKQSGQNWLPQLTELQTIETFFKRPPEEDLLLIASLHAEARSLPSIVREFREIQKKPPSSALVLIGPEGDFTPAESATAQRQGCLPWTLGPIVLRSETAALYALSVLGYELGHRDSH